MLKAEFNKINLDLFRKFNQSGIMKNCKTINYIYPNSPKGIEHNFPSGGYVVEILDCERVIDDCGIVKWSYSTNTAFYYSVELKKEMISFCDSIDVDFITVFDHSFNRQQSKAFIGFWFNHFN